MNKSAKNTAVLLIEDNPADARLVQEYLKDCRHKVFSFRRAGTLKDGLVEIGLELPDILLLDMNLPDASGMQGLLKVTSEFPGLPVIVMTGLDDEETGILAVQHGAQDYLVKGTATSEMLSRAIAYAIERHHTRVKIEEKQLQELKLAFQIQKTLLIGHPPVLPHAEISSISIPSQGVDGDFYDFFPNGARRLDVVLGDVMGKGLPAAFVAAAAKQSFFKAAHLSDCSASDIMLKVCQDLEQPLLDLEVFITILFASFDFVANKAVLANLGHIPGIHINHKTGELQLLHGSNPPLGLIEMKKIVVTEHEFDAGDLFIFLTDGIPEAADAIGNRIGMEPVLAHLKEVATQSSETIIARLVEFVSGFAGGDKFSDDLTCIALRIC